MISFLLCNWWRALRNPPCSFVPAIPQEIFLVLKMLSSIDVWSIWISIISFLLSVVFAIPFLCLCLKTSVFFKTYLRSLTLNTFPATTFAPIVKEYLNSQFSFLLNPKPSYKMVYRASLLGSPTTLQMSMSQSILINLSCYVPPTVSLRESTTLEISHFPRTDLYVLSISFTWNYNSCLLWFLNRSYT